MVTPLIYKQTETRFEAVHDIIERIDFGQYIKLSTNHLCYGCNTDIAMNATFSYAVFVLCSLVVRILHA